MLMPPKEEEYRINIRIDKETREKLDLIKSIGIKSDTNAVTIAIYHLAQHIEKGEVFTDKNNNGNNIVG